MHTTILGGPNDPMPQLPKLESGQLRRTTTAVISSPEGFEGPLHLHASGSDMYLGRDGAASTLREATITGRLERWTSEIIELVAEPPHPVLDASVGRSARQGFRRWLREVAQDDLDETDLRFQMLDDLPGTTIVADYPAVHDGAAVPPERMSDEHFADLVDVCAGWSDEGEAMVVVRFTGGPLVPPGAPLPAAGGERPQPELPPQSTRRHRVTDVSLMPGGGYAVETLFRDSFTDANAGCPNERVLHEYIVSAVLDAAGETFIEMSATPRVLPWKECPGAAASARRLVGSRPADLGELLRTSFSGTSTCTHLNDTFRSLAACTILAHDLAMLLDDGAMSNP